MEGIFTVLFLQVFQSPYPHSPSKNKVVVSIFTGLVPRIVGANSPFLKYANRNSHNPQSVYSPAKLWGADALRIWV